MGLSRAWTWLGVAASLPVLGCAKGSGLDSTGSPFGVGSASSTASSTNAMTTAASGDSASDTASESGTSGVTTGTDEGSTASPELCGNSMIDPGEACDGALPEGVDCASEGFAGGTLVCAPDCELDTSGCTTASCGDGTLQDGESCDCGGAPCTAAQLGDQVCTALPAPSGGGNYGGGTLGCTAMCAFDEAACTYCGNAVRDGMEACDGADLAGATCATQGFDAGTLGCSATCTFVTTSCITYACGNGSCEPGEDSCACPSDCPTDPNSCDSPCECGGSGGNCFCDAACVMYGDCCPNGPC